MTKQTLTLREAAAFLGRKPQLIHYYAKQGRIPTVLVGGKMHYELEEIQGWKPVSKPIGAPKKVRPA